MSASSNHDPTLVAAAARRFHDERQLWRERTLHGSLLSVGAAACFAAAWFTLVPHGVGSLAALLQGLALLLVALLFARQRLSFVLRGTLFLGSVFLTCLYASLFFFGFSPNCLVGYSTLAVATALLFGRLPAIFVVGMGSLAILGVSVAHYTGAVQQLRASPTTMDSALLVNGLRVAGIFTLLSASSVVGLSYLLRRSEELVLEQARSFRALRDEQLEKERLQADLVLGEAALTKARELETLGRLAGSMAHDFNNSLLVIFACIDELSEFEQLSPAGREALSMLRAAADQGATTTRNLRAFGPLGPRRPTILALAPVLSKARATLARVLPPNILLAEDLQLDAAVAADEGEILRVLTNLALNARDAMPEGGRLVLRMRPVSDAERARCHGDAGWVAIDVEDTGTGMADEVKQRLFEPFFTTKQAAGTGLGLATVRDVMRAHGGDVLVASELGQGTTITLLWPVALESTRPPPDSAVPELGSGCVVLLVDDDPAVLSTLGKSLTRAGFTVLRASSASAGLEALRRGKLAIHVLCTDWMMPGRPVRVLIEEFRRVHAGPVLVWSGYAPAETGLSLELVDDFLAKPFSGGELVRHIRRLLAKRNWEAPALRV
jgi:signal transduction histidine kinase/CheY-like chemotaxis protein